MMSSAPSRITPRERTFVLIASAICSGTALWWSWSHAAFLLYGDAEAHIHIARRLFDSHRPGLTQLGSVWLPLPHLLLVPFIWVNSWWRSGLGAAIPSVICYFLACAGIYVLARKWLLPLPAALGLIVFASNPNLLYLQTTAMTEPLFLCELIWSVLLLVDWYNGLDSELQKSSQLWAVIAVLVAAVFTRYDGWILAAFAWAVMAVCLHRRRRLLKFEFILVSIVLLIAPLSWMLYNAVVFGDWLDFIRGPYSARAIELRTSTSAIDPHPGWHNPWVATVYFLKAAEMDAAIWGELLSFLAAIGTVWAWIRRDSITPGNKGILWTLLLWLPLPFYAYSVSYGSVPIFLPVWKPFSWYNTRYGMELLPALAFFTGCALQPVLQWLKLHSPRLVTGFAALLIAAQVMSIAIMLHEGPLTYVEAAKNTAARAYYNRVLADALRRLHAADPKGVVLMDTSMYPSLVPHSGLTYSQTINESDKEFYWAALGAPSAHADIVLAFAGDDIDKSVHAHPEHLKVVQRFHSPNQGWDQQDATLYVTDTFPPDATP